MYIYMYYYGLIFRGACCSSLYIVEQMQSILFSISFQEDSNEDKPPTVIVESPVNVGGITVQGQNLLAGQQYVARENPLGGITLVPVVNILSSESVVGGASIITDGNLVDGVDRIDGVPVVTANVSK